MRWAQLNTDTETATLKRTKQRGFTIVELLIVIVVIAILAAISIVAYTGIQNRANDSAVQSDLSAFSKKLEIYRIDRPGGDYPPYISSEMNMNLSFTKSAYENDELNANLRYCSSGSRYVMYARSKSGTYYAAIDGSVATTSKAYGGFGVCEKIGRTSANPGSNGLSGTTWSEWTGNGS